MLSKWKVVRFQIPKDKFVNLRVYECNRDISRHMQNYGLRKNREEIPDEQDLIFGICILTSHLWVGLFFGVDHFLDLQFRFTVYNILFSCSSYAQRKLDFLLYPIHCTCAVSNNIKAPNANQGFLMLLKGTRAHLLLSTSPGSPWDFT